MDSGLLLVPIKLSPEAARPIYVFYIITTSGIRLKFADIIKGVKNDPVASAPKMIDELYEVIRNYSLSNQTVQIAESVR